MGDYGKGGSKDVRAEAIAKAEVRVAAERQVYQEKSKASGGLSAGGRRSDGSRITSATGKRPEITEAEIKEASRTITSQRAQIEILKQRDIERQGGPNQTPGVFQRLAQQQGIDLQTRKTNQTNAYNSEVGRGTGETNAERQYRLKQEYESRTGESLSYSKSERLASLSAEDRQTYNALKQSAPQTAKTFLDKREGSKYNSVIQGLTITGGPVEAPSTSTANVSGAIEVAPQDYAAVNKALERSNLIIDQYNTGQEPSLKLTKGEIKLLEKYGIDNPHTLIANAKAEAKASELELQNEWLGRGYTLIPTGAGEYTVEPIPGQKQYPKITFEPGTPSSEIRAGLDKWYEAGFGGATVSIDKKGKKSYSLVPRAGFEKQQQKAQQQELVKDAPTQSDPFGDFSKGVIAEGTNIVEGFRAGIEGLRDVWFRQVPRTTYDKEGNVISTTKIKEPDFKPAVETDLISLSFKAGSDLVTTGKTDVSGQDYAKVGENILKNPAYAAGNIGVSLAGYFGPQAATKATKIAKGTIAISDSAKIEKAAALAAKEAGIQDPITGLQPIKITSKAGKIVKEEPLSIGALGITYGKVQIPNPIAKVKDTLRLKGNPKVKDPLASEPTTATGKLASQILDQESFSVSVPKRADAVELLSDLETIGTFDLKSESVSISTTPQTLEAGAAITGQSIVEPTSVIAPISKGPGRGEKVGLDIAEMRLRNIQRQKGEAFAQYGLFVSSKQTTGLRRLGAVIADNPRLKGDLTAITRSGIRKLSEITGLDELSLRRIADVRKKNLPKSDDFPEGYKIRDAVGGVTSGGKILSSTGELIDPQTKRIVDLYRFGSKDLLTAASESDVIASRSKSAKAALSEARAAERKARRDADAFASSILEPDVPKKGSKTPLETQSVYDFDRTLQFSKARRDALLEDVVKSSRAEKDAFGTITSLSLGLGGATGRSRRTREETVIESIVYPPAYKDSEVARLLDRFAYTPFQTSNQIESLRETTASKIGIPDVPSNRQRTVKIEDSITGGFRLDNVVTTKDIPITIPRTGTRTTPVETTINIPGIDIPGFDIPVPRVPNVTSLLPPLPKGFGFGFDLSGSSRASRSRRSERLFEMYDPYVLTFSSRDRRRLVGFGYDDYSDGILQEYGNIGRAFGGGRKSKKSKRKR